MPKDGDRVQLPGLQTLFGIRSEDPLSSLQYLAQHDLARTHSTPSSRMPTPSYASHAPSIASSSRSDPSAFSLHHDGASIHSWTGSSSEWEDGRSVDEAPWSSLEDAPTRSPGRLHSDGRQRQRSPRAMPSIAALRHAGMDMPPPLAPPRSSSLRSRPPTAPSPLGSPRLGGQYAGQGDYHDMARGRSDSIASIEQPFYHRPDQPLLAASEGLYRRPSLPTGLPRPDTSGSDTASLRSFGFYSDRSSFADPIYRPAPFRDFASFSSGSCSPRSSISTAATSYRAYEDSFEQMSISSPPSSIFPAPPPPRPRPSMELIHSRELPPIPTARPHPLTMAANSRQPPLLPPPPLPPPPPQSLAGVLQSVSEAPMRYAPEHQPSTAPPYVAPPPAPSSSAASSTASKDRTMRYKCPHCSRGFSRPSSLRIHVFSHTGEKPNTCDQCGRSFSVRSNLTRHMRIHTTAAQRATTDSEMAEEGDESDDGEQDADSMET